MSMYHDDAFSGSWWWCVFHKCFISDSSAMHLRTFQGTYTDNSSVNSREKIKVSTPTDLVVRQV